METNHRGVAVFYKFIIITLLASLLSLNTVFAQNPKEVPVVLDSDLVPPGPNLPQINANTSGAVDCFDYYKFGSIQVQVAPYFGGQVNAGDSLLFGGELINNNPYPLVDGQIYMKIFKMEQDSDELFRENGYPLVDFVLVEDNIALATGEVRPLEFGWTVPKNSAEGEYMAAFFFTTARSYNLLGLSFTDDVTGNTTSFTISSDEPYTPVVFDKNSVRLNDTRTSFALPPRHFGGDGPVTSYATLVNESDEEKRLELSWTAYKWDGIRDDFKQDVKKEFVQIPPQSSIDVSYDTPIKDTAVTFVQAEIIDGDAKSMLHIRYVRDGIPETRINFPSTFTYPLVAGEEATLFSCVHSTNEPVVPGNTLTLTLEDVNGNTLHSYTYEGDITGAMMGLKDSFVPDKSYGSFSLTASLMRDGKLVETVTTTYDCNNLDPGLCTEADKLADPVAEPIETNQNQLLVLVSLLLLIIVLAGLYYKLRKGAPNKDQTIVDDLGGSNNNN